MIDAARADALSAYGNPLATTPRIDELAAEGTLFERAYSQATWTLPSTASFLSGRYPAGWKLNRVAAGQTIAASLQAAGLRTGAFSENPYVTRPHGFANGFDTFREYFPTRLIRRSPRRYARRDSEQTIDDAVRWIRADTEQPFFAYLHLLPPHAPYDPPEPFEGHFDPDYEGPFTGRPEELLEVNEGTRELEPRDLEHLRLAYYENLAFADHQVGRLLDALAESGLDDRTLVILTSDHGEAFGEHGFLLHNVSLYDEVIRVPLVIRFPARLGVAPGRHAGVVEIRQLAATVCDVLAVEGCPRLSTSLLDVVRDGDEASGFALSFSSTPSGERLAGVVSKEHKLVVGADGSRQLFDLAADPGETRDVAGERPEVADRLAAQLESASGVRVETQERAIDEETREQLRALGYAE